MLLKCKNTAFRRAEQEKSRKGCGHRYQLSIYLILNLLLFSLNIVISQSSKEILFPLTPYYIGVKGQLLRSSSRRIG